MREKGFRAVGGLAQRLTSDIAKSRGKGRGASVVQLKAEWSAIVGAELARVTEPDALLAGRGGKSGKALRMRVTGAAALEVQHQSGQFVERVNAYLGHKFIDEIRLVQGAIARAPTSRPLPAPDPQTVKRMADKVAEVSDPDLRAALHVARPARPAGLAGREGWGWAGASRAAVAASEENRSDTTSSIHVLI